MFIRDTTRKSVRWLFAELTVVVLGILIAFQIDNYREYLDQREEERLVLEELLDDLRQDQARIDDAMAAKRAQRAGIEGYIAYLNEAERNAEDYAHAFRPILRNYGYFPIDHTFEGLRMNGRLFVVSDKVLTKSLLKHYDGTRPLLLGVQAVVDGFWQEVRERSSPDVFFGVPGLAETSFTDVKVDEIYSFAVTAPVMDAPRDPLLLPLLGNMRASITNYLNLCGILRDESTQLELQIAKHLERL